MNRKITSAKLTKDNTLEIGYIDQDDETNKEYTLKCNNIAHPDLVAAFASLSIHIAYICELPEAGNLTAEELAEVHEVENIRFSKFIRAIDSNSPGVTLVAYRDLQNDKGMNIISPFMKDEDLTGEFHEQLSICENEVMEYLEGKQAPKRQIEMDFEGNLDDDDLHMDDEGVKVLEKAKRGRKKKTEDTD